MNHHILTSQLHFSLVQLPRSGRQGLNSIHSILCKACREATRHHIMAFRPDRLWFLPEKGMFSTELEHNVLEPSIINRYCNYIIIIITHQFIYIYYNSICLLGTFLHVFQAVSSLAKCAKSGGWALRRLGWASGEEASLRHAMMVFVFLKNCFFTYRSSKA